MKSLKGKLYLTVVFSLSLLLVFSLTGCINAAAARDIKDEPVSSTAMVNDQPVKKQRENKKKEKKKTGSVDNADVNVSLIMVGDILLHDAVNSNCRLEDGSYDYSNIFKNTLKETEKADFALVNQEVIIGGRDLGVTGYPSFNAPYEIADALYDAGFDVICHATNHALDRGKRGLVNCLMNWREKYPDVAVLGIHDDGVEAEDIFICEKQGIRIAILNYTYGTNGVNAPKDMPFAVDLLRKEKVINDLRKADELADITVVCPHWGTEYSLEISDEQEEWSRIFLENGADLVIGTHPHVIEPIKWVVNEETGDKMLVYYSLGNYVNCTSDKGKNIANRMVGGMALVNIGKDEEGNAVISDWSVEALVCHLSREKGGITVYRLRDYDEDLARSNEIVNKDPAFTKQYCIDLCNKVWGDKWE